MRASSRAASLLAVLVAVVVTTASGASAEDPIGGPLLTGTAVVVDPHPGTPNPPAVDAGSFVLADADTGEIFAAKAPHQRLKPASTLKMLTAIALLPELDLDDRYTATFDDDAQIGSAVGIVEGHTYTIDQLFVGLFLSSGNDAAHAIANAAGGLDAALALMAEETERIQALDTVAMNTSGLDADGQVSSAYDLALIGRAGLQIPEFRAYTATREARFPTKEGTSTYAISNHNTLLDTYPGAIGIKNGYTKASGYTFIGAATRGDRTLIVALMKGEENVQREAATLLDWGFEYAAAVEPIGVLVDPIPDEPPPSPTPTQAPAAGAGSTDDSATQEMLIAGALGALAVAAGGAGTAITIRRVRRRRALRAELVHWATMRRPARYGPPPRPRGQPGPPRPPYRQPQPASPPDRRRAGAPTDPREPARSARGPAPHRDRWRPPHDVHEHPPRGEPGPPPPPPYGRYRQPRHDDGHGEPRRDY